VVDTDRVLVNVACTMRALGLDVGSKTIGVAITDEAEIAAHPLRVIARQGIARDVQELATLIAEHHITHVVVGLPLELSGRVGHRAKRVRALTEPAQRAVPADVEWIEQDERFTTAAAERVLLEADLSRAKRKRVIDQQAAALILQSWLHHRHAARAR
jgi:putative Holliday junction resolvase